MNTSRISLRLTDGEKQIADEAASAAGIDRTTAIRAAIRRLRKSPLKSPEKQPLPIGLASAEPGTAAEVGKLGGKPRKKR